MSGICTTCLLCRISTAVGSHRGYFGLPSLTDRPGVHREGGFELATWTNEGGAEGSQSFGYIYGGFKALAVMTQPLETYASFLRRHASHRLVAWVDSGNQGRLEELELSDALPFESYSARPENGFEEAILVFRCGNCDVEVEGYEPFSAREK